MRMDKNGRLGFSITSGSSPSGQYETVEIKVEDWDSHEPLAVIEMSVADMWAVLRGTHWTGDGFIGVHLDRVGKRIATLMVKVPKDVYESLSYGDEVRKPACLTWARQHGWGTLGPRKAGRQPEEMRVQNSNEGWKAVYQWWLTPAEVERDAARDADR